MTHSDINEAPNSCSLWRGSHATADGLGRGFVVYNFRPRVSRGALVMEIYMNIIRDRREVLAASAAVTINAAVTQLGLTGSAAAQSQSSGLPAIKPGTNTSFAPLKQIEAGVLDIGYAEAGPANGAPVILLHGWPYDIHDYIDVAPLLAAQGYHVVIPH